jgi:hypothetical protein
MPRSSECSFPFRFTNQNTVCISHLSHVFLLLKIIFTTQVATKLVLIMVVQNSGRNLGITWYRNVTAIINDMKMWQDVNREQQYGSTEMRIDSLVSTGILSLCLEKFTSLLNVAFY